MSPKPVDFSKFTKKDLIVALKLYERRLKFASERCNNLEKQMKTDREHWSDLLRELSTPKRFSVDGDRLWKWLYDLDQAIRELWHIENKKYAIGDLAMNEKTPPKKKAVAKILFEFLSYFDIDDE